MLIGLGSVPSSGLPHLEMTLSTSGTDASAERNRPLMRCASVTDTEVGRLTLIQIEPSFSSGRNSVPSLGTHARLAARATSAVARTFFLLPIAQASAGSYTPLQACTSAFSLSGRFLRNSQTQSKGTSVSERISEPIRAEVTDQAMGAKIRPS